MIVTPPGTTPVSVTLPDGREAWLTEKEHKRALNHEKHSRGPMSEIVQTMLDVDAEDHLETERRYRATRMAVDGEWGGLRRALDLWVEATT